MRARLVLVAVLIGASLSGCATAPATSGVDAQLEYLHTYVDERNAEAFGSLSGTDCVNFTSQGLLARGWEQNSEWWHVDILGWHRYAKPWISSTAFSDYLSEHPELAEPTDAAGVVLGDILQFDWDDSGNRDHTATVSRIDADGSIYVIQHSEDAEYASATQLIADHDAGIGQIYYWHLVD